MRSIWLFPIYRYSSRLSPRKECLSLSLLYPLPACRVYLLCSPTHHLLSPYLLFCLEVVHCTQSIFSQYMAAEIRKWPWEPILLHFCLLCCPVVLYGFAWPSRLFTAKLLDLVFSIPYTCSFILLSCYDLECWIARAVLFSTPHFFIIGIKILQTYDILTKHLHNSLQFSAI